MSSCLPVLIDISGPGSLGRLFSRHGWDFQNELEDHYDGVAKVTGMLGVRSHLATTRNPD